MRRRGAGSCRREPCTPRQPRRCVGTTCNIMCVLSTSGEKPGFIHRTWNANLLQRTARSAASYPRLRSNTCDKTYLDAWDWTPFSTVLIGDVGDGDGDAMLPDSNWASRTCALFIRRHPHLGTHSTFAWSARRGASHGNELVLATDASTLLVIGYFYGSEKHPPLRGIIVNTRHSGRVREFGSDGIGQDRPGRETEIPARAGNRQYCLARFVCLRRCYALSRTEIYRVKTAQITCLKEFLRLLETDFVS